MFVEPYSQKTRINIAIIGAILLLIAGLASEMIAYRVKSVLTETGIIDAPIIFDEYDNVNDLGSVADMLEETMKVNFPEVKKVHPEAVGWLRILNTDINHSVVQKPEDNSFYLTHNAEGKSSELGWLFLDGFANGVSLGKNTVIYGHDRKDNKMFGSLHGLLANDFLSKGGSKYILYATEYEVRVYEVFSVYETSPSSMVNTLDFTNSAFKAFTDGIKSKNTAKWVSDEALEAYGDVLTLATCIGKENRLYVHSARVL